MKFGKMFKIVLSVLLVLAMLVACTPAADVNNNDNNPGGSSTPGDNNSTQPGGEGAEYLQQLLDSEFDASLASFKEIYAKIMEGLTDGNALNAFAGGKIDTTLTLSQDLLDMLEMAIFGGDNPEVDLGFLSKINISTDMGMDGNMQKMQLALALNDQEIVKLNVLMNMAEYIIYAAAPDLNENWIVFDGSEMMAGGNVAGAVNSAAMMSAMAKALPDAETMTKVLDRYFKLILPGLKNVEQSTVKLEADGVQQECTQLTLKIYEADALAICKSVLTAAKDDADLKKIIIDAYDAIAEMSGMEASGAEAYASIKEMITGTLEYMENVEETDTENPIVVTLYVDNNHKIIGAKIATPDYVSENCMFYMYTLTSGDKTGFEMAIPDSQTSGEYDFHISGSGTTTGGKTNATYKINVQGKNKFTIKVENWTENGGVITITPDKSMGDQLGIPLLQGEPALQIKIADETIELKLINGSKLILGLALKAMVSNGPDLSIPSNATDAMDSNAMQAWAENLDIDKLIDNLKNAGAYEFFELLFKAVESPAQPMPEVSVNPDNSWG